MTTFADTSALVKLYVDETGFEVVRAIKEPILISDIARVEIAAALWKKQGMQQVSVEDVGLLLQAFEFDVFGDADSEPLFHSVAVTSAIVSSATRLAGIHGLRAYDAIQLATAKAARELIADCRQFAAFDIDLRHAALTEGFALIP